MRKGQTNTKVIENGEENCEILSSIHDMAMTIMFS